MGSIVRKENTSILARFSAALKSFVHPGWGGTVSGSSFGGPWWDNVGGWLKLPGTKYDYRAEAGLVWQNSIVYACLSFTATAFNEADLRVEVKRSGRWVPIIDHELVDLLERPNPYYNGEILWASTILSLEASGNAYWIKVRNPIREVVELWYVPHWMIRPNWDTAGKHFIQGYTYRVNGKLIQLKRDDVVHLRGKFLDPMNPRVGISPLDAALREVCTDNEASTFMAAVLRNGGFPGLVVSPDPSVFGELDEGLTEQQRNDLKRGFDETFTGDGRGSTYVQSIPIKIDVPGYTPEQLVLEKTRGLSEERICACLELPPVVVHMGSGLSKTTAKASHKESKQQAYDSKIMPLQKSLAAQVTLQMMGDFEPTAKRYRLGWDWSNVLAMQEDLNERAKRYQIACGGPWMTVNEIRELEAYDKIDGGDELRTGKAGESSESEDKPTEKEKDDNRDAHDD